MNGFNYILTKQITWANRNKISLVGSEISKGREAYTKRLDENLFEPFLTKTQAEFEEQLKEESVLNKHIAENFAKIDLPVRVARRQG
jgi:hypothetical protein